MLAYLRKYKPNSLFYKLLFHFFAVILLLTSYNAWSLTYYNRSVDSEVVTYNRTIIRNTVDSLEHQFTVWQGLLLSLQFDERLPQLAQQGRENGKASLDYTLVNQVIGQLRSLSSNPSYLFDNVMVHFKQLGFFLDKESLIDADRMFEHYYASDSYPLAYWLRKDGLTSDLTPSPARLFRMDAGNRTRLLMPVELNLPGSAWSIVGMVNMDRWYAGTRGIADSQLFILKNGTQSLFQTAPDAEPAALPAWDGVSRWQLLEDTYYFYERGDETGFTYVTAIPRSRMNANLSRMNWLALGLFTATLLFGVLASFLFSRSINRPLKQMMAGIGSAEPVAARTSIREFNAIYEQISSLLREKDQISQKLTSSKSLLTHYSYMARLKNLYLHLREAKELLIAEGAYLVVVHQLRYRPSRLRTLNLGDSLSKTTGSVGDLIDLTIRQSYPVSYTIQMESDQLLTVLYTNERSEQLAACLGELKRVLDQDTGYYVATLAVSPLTTSSAGFHQAYEEAIHLLKQARPLGETQILWEPREANGSGPIGLTADQEQALAVQLQAGHAAGCLQQLDRILQELGRGDSTAHQLRRAAEAIAGLARRTVEQTRAELPEAFAGMPDVLDDCFTAEEYQAALGALLTESADTIRCKREENSDLMHMVRAYLETHYADEISLDSLADRLQLTPNYLSMTIKERTGKTFSEQLNEIRIAKAKELLEQTKMTIQEVGERIGYRNATSFNRMFKKETGMPPGDYRKTVLRSG